MGIKGELARSADMSRPDANGNYNLGSSLYTREVKDDEGEVVDKEVIEEVLRERFLKPLPPRWATGPNLKRVVLDVACGGNHILVTARDPGQFASKLYSSGLNNYGQLGHGDCGDNTERHELTLVRFQNYDMLVYNILGEVKDLTFCFSFSYVIRSKRSRTRTLPRLLPANTFRWR